MASTRFATPTGLPASDQRTTARDMALLSMALIADFPDRLPLFEARSAQAAGRRVPTTNPLFGRVQGASGLKTGFTCAAGYSIVALQKLEGRQVLAVTLGHKTKSARLSAIGSLLARAMQAEGRATLASAPAASRSVPDIGACAGTQTLVASTDPEPLDRETALAILAAVPGLDIDAGWQPRVEPPPPPLSGWGLFLGAYASEERAARHAFALADRLSGHVQTEHRARDGRYVAYLYGLEARTAKLACERLRQRDLYCVTLNPQTLRNPRARWRL